MLKEYHVKWFCHGEWAWIEEDLLAESITQVRAYVDQRSKPEWRTVPYRLSNEPERDSLSIKLIRSKISLPIVMWSSLSG